LRVIPERGQPSKNLAHRSPAVDHKQAWDVLQQHEPGSKAAKEPGGSGPEPAGVVEATPSAGAARGLAREPSREERDGLESFRSDG
jgi:hypothetical protein